ncbi:uncharacterized protein TA21035 [Theileria annulata]|uniref:Uncharacterized protein n=1 Tax=Theileria annulata TaxID=5874 RepID=Q4UGU9_THEAN|nr:uncharacterized protein TA21035 [Theileria annulata]CAI73690.1 hypothetical protein TA21035 [Theileria annulata]|eukprot:XP_954367.1 hypothetical protein TA21035 [Theileria annulata]
MDDEQDSTFINVKTNTSKPEKKHKKNKRALHVEISEKNLDNTTHKKVLKENKITKKDNNKDNLNYVRLLKEIPQVSAYYSINSSLRGYLSLENQEIIQFQTLTIYGVNEVVLYNDTDDKSSKWMEYFSLNLRYLETPQYLRKFLFPMDNGISIHLHIYINSFI